MGLSVFAVIIYNIIIVFTNTQKKYIVRIDRSNSHYKLGLTNLYFGKISETNVLIEKLRLVVHVKESESEGTTLTFKFFDKTSNQQIGKIKPRHVIWTDHYKQVRRALSELKKSGVEIDVMNKKHSLGIQRMFE